MSTEPTANILIVDDDPKTLLAMEALLSGPGRATVTAASGQEALRWLLRRDFSVILMDVRMPNLDGIAATREVLAVSPEIKVAILTTFEEDDYIFGALNAGASGFLLKRTRPEELLAAVHTLAAGDSLLSPSVTRRVIERMAERPLADPGRWHDRRRSLRRPGPPRPPRPRPGRVGCGLAMPSTAPARRCGASWWRRGCCAGARRIACWRCAGVFPTST